MARSRGSAASLKILDEVTYGVAQAVGGGTNYTRMPFVTADLDEAQALLPSDLLGQGREPQDPTPDVIDVNGPMAVPLDQRAFAHWLFHGMAAPVLTPIAATGKITFNANPAINDTITINGSVFTFIAGASTATEIQIGGTPTLTATEAASVLNGSADGNVTPATYLGNGADLEITHDTTGTAGNAFTLAASFATPADVTVSAATLQGGGYQRDFVSGQDPIPSASIEVGHEKVPAFFLNLGCLVESFSFSMQRGGLTTANLQLLAQGQEAATAVTADAAATELAISRFSAGRGFILVDDAQIPITGGQFTFNNNFDPVPTIRDDGKIDGYDPGVNSMTGQIAVRFADLDLVNKAKAGTPIKLQYGYSAPGAVLPRLELTMERVFLPLPRKTINGPGGVEVTYDWQAAKASGPGVSLTARLHNDVQQYEFEE